MISIKGYWVTVFSKQEIVFSYEQKIKKAKGLSHTTPIDYKQNSFFIPLQIGDKIVCEKDTIIRNFLNYTQNDSIYIVPTINNNNLLKSINIITTDLHKEIYVLSNAMYLSPYYEIKGNNDLLFKCTYIEGCAKHKRIQEIEKKWQNYLLNICFIDKKRENVQFFFIVKISNYTPYVEISELTKWLPYL